MKKTLLILCTFILASGVVLAQDQDPKAKVILDKLSEKSKTYETLYAEFTYNLLNKSQGNMNITQKGKIWVKGKKYQLKLDDNMTIINDGRYMWALDKSSGSGTKSNLPDPDDFGIDPANLFNIHNEDFKYKLIKEDASNAEIDLFPMDPKKVNFISVKMHIDKTNSQIKKIIVKGREGAVYTYTINKFTPNATVSDSKLKLDRSQWPEIDDWTDLTDDGE